MLVVVKMCIISAGIRGENVGGSHDVYYQC